MNGSPWFMFILFINECCQHTRIHSVHTVDWVFVSLDRLVTIIKHMEQLGRQNDRNRAKLPDGGNHFYTATSETVGFHFTCCCSQRNLNIYPVCLAMAPAGGDISHL